MGHGARLEAFIRQLKAWAATQDEIDAIALVGSHARGTACPDSDVDLVILTADPSGFLDDLQWANTFGTPMRRDHEDYGAVQSIRVHFMDGLEVEFGFASPAWASTNPAAAGTIGVVRNGFAILFDRNARLHKLLTAVQ
jgi:predicted nucleotidyltransferase